MISDQEIDEAVHWLSENASRAAQRRAERIYAEEYRKSLKSILMKEYGEQSAVQQERDAYAHERYLAHLQELKKAVYQDEFNRAQRAAKEILIEAWRTQSSNSRAVKL